MSKWLVKGDLIVLLKFFIISFVERCLEMINLQEPYVMCEQQTKWDLLAAE